MGELIGDARCSTVLQDITAQRQALAALGVPDNRIYLESRSRLPQFVPLSRRRAHLDTDHAP